MKFVEPDISFIKELKKDSGADLKQCMQCGTCSVVCDLSPEDNPFPRKEMIWASWGLKDKLMGDPDIWLCHQCGDCTTYCPRGIKPGDVISSIRNLSYYNYAKPKAFVRILKNPIFLPLVLAFPAIIILGIIYLAGTLHIPEGEIEYSKFFPHSYLNISFLAIVLFVAAGMIISIKNFWNDLKKNMPFTEKKLSYTKSLISVLNEIIFHRNFNKCTSNKFRFYSHLLVFGGFVILLVVTIFAIIAVLFFEYPLSLWNPVKIAGNLAALMLLAGLTIMIYKRIANKNVAGKTNYFDWFFLVSIYLLTISGVLVEIARFQNWASAYFIYFLHLVLVWIIIIYAPYTKFGHVIYRTVAMVYARSIGRNTKFRL